MRRDRWIYPGAWLAFLLIYWDLLASTGLPVGLALRNAICVLLPDALLGLALFRVPAVLRWPEGRKTRFFIAHIGLLLAFMAVSLGGWIALTNIDSLVFDGHFLTKMYVRFIPIKLLVDLLLYCALAGIAYAAQYGGEVRAHAERAAKSEALRARASLEAMRSQLNPHFILNTFHALVGLVRREPAIAEDALERLGDLLRYSLRIQKAGIDEVPLREERAFVDSYLALERLRLGDRLKVTFDAPPSTLEYLVPTFSVQILVENAIRHAIAPRAAGGRLYIAVEQVNSHLRIAVRDEGEGELSDAGADGSGIGLRLLQERLAALYGNDAHLALRRMEGGTLADLEFPARVRSEDLQ